MSLAKEPDEDNITASGDSKCGGVALDTEQEYDAASVCDGDLPCIHTGFTLCCHHLVHGQFTTEVSQTLPNFFLRVVHRNCFHILTVFNDIANIFMLLHILYLLAEAHGEGTQEAGFLSLHTSGSKALMVGELVIGQPGKQRYIQDISFNT